MINEDIMAKLEQQEQKLKERYGADATALGAVTAHDFIAPVDVNAPAVDSAPAPISLVDTPIPSQPARGPLVTPGLSTMERIQAVEAQLGNVTYNANQSTSYLDERGVESWYVKNISGTHVVVADIEGAIIKRGKVTDLLSVASEEAIKKSKDLRNCLFAAGKTKLLMRLTPEEYLQEKEKELKMTMEVDRIKSINAPVAEDEKKIRPVVMAKLEKYNLSLSRIPEEALLGLTRPEFVDWFMHAELSEYEIEYLMAGVKDTDVRSALARKKTLI